jgi:MarR family transcriptional regulator for hemolysin
VARPTRTPIGIQLASAAKVVNRAFEDALAEAGGSSPVWLILVNLKTQPTSSQRELADAIGIEGPTLTHHLNAMESAGLITRRRDPNNRRLHLVEVTAAGDETFHRLRGAVLAFDRRLRRGFSERDLAQVERLLERLRANVDGA